MYPNVIGEIDQSSIRIVPCMVCGRGSPWFDLAGQLSEVAPRWIIPETPGEKPTAMNIVVAMYW